MEIKLKTIILRIFSIIRALCAPQTLWNLNFSVSAVRVFRYYIEWTLCRLFGARALRMPLTEIKRAFNVLWTRDRFIDSEHNNRFRSIDVIQREKKKKKEKNNLFREPLETSIATFIIFPHLFVSFSSFQPVLFPSSLSHISSLYAWSRSDPLVT